MVRLCGVWKELNKDGETFLSGSLGSARIVILPNYYKEKDTQPDYIVYLDSTTQAKGIL